MVALTQSDYSEIRQAVLEYLEHPEDSWTSSFINRAYLKAADYSYNLFGSSVLGMCFYGPTEDSTKIHVNRCRNPKTFILTFLHELTHKAICWLGFSIEKDYEEEVCDTVAEYLYKRLTRRKKNLILGFRGC